MSSVRLFVYGSLKAGFRHHDQLEGATFLRAAETAGGHRLVLAGEYPALVPDPAAPSERALGELYEVPRSMLPALDAFEDCPDLYQREEITLSDGAVVFAYVMDAKRAARFETIPGGSWTRTLEAQRSDIGL